jgi:hypothetical protein
MEKWTKKGAAAFSIPSEHTSNLSDVGRNTKAQLPAIKRADDAKDNRCGGETPNRPLGRRVNGSALLGGRTCNRTNAGCVCIAHGS